MIGKNIRHYRLQAGLSQDVFSEKTGLSLEDIRNYEENVRMPDGDAIKKICDGLGISVSKLLVYQNGSVNITEEHFGNSDDLSGLQKELVLSQIECHANKYMLLAEILGDEVSKSSFPDESVSPYQDSERSAEYMRDALGIAPTEPIGNLLEIVERAGVLVILLNTNVDSFSEFCCRTEQGFSIIAVNSNMDAEQQRISVVKALVRLLFDMVECRPEREVDDIVGCFLLPKAAIIRELGVRRKRIGLAELMLVRDRYGVSEECVVRRVLQAGIISDSIARQKLPTTRFSFKDVPEVATRFKQLVCRAFFEDEIGINKVAEMLEIPIIEARNICVVG